MVDFVWYINLKVHMDVSLNGGTPKSSIFTRFFHINHPFWGTAIFGNHHIPFPWDAMTFPGNPTNLPDLLLPRELKIHLSQRGVHCVAVCPSGVN